MLGEDVGRLCTERGWSRDRLLLEMKSAARGMAVSLPSDDSLRRMIRQWSNSDRGLSPLYVQLFGLVFGVASGPCETEVGLSYEHDLSTVVTTVSKLAQLDLSGHQALRSEKYNVAGLQSLCLDWLTRQDVDELPAMPDSVATIDHIDLDELRALRETVDEFDRRFGGERHRLTAVRYLNDVVVPKLREVRDDVLSREYLRESAIMCELIGWMSYDAREHPAAQPYFAQAVRLAQAAGDEGYAAFAVTSMADQALFAGQPREALRFARVALSRTARALPAVVLAEANVFEARACAALGDSRAALASLAKAEEAFGRTQAGDTPSWAAHWSSAVLLSHRATCYVDLGLAREADLALVQIGQSIPDQPRRRLYWRLQQSRSALLAHDGEAALAHAEAAVDALGATRSRRAQKRVQDQVMVLGELPELEAGVGDLRGRLQARRAS